MLTLLEKLDIVLKNKSQAFETPCYIHDAESLNAQLNKLEQQLGTPVITSLKANPNVDLNLRLIHHRSGVEVTSLKELNIANHSHTVYINNPSMDRNLIRAGLAAKAHFTIDSLEQLNTLVELAGARPINPVILRLNVSVLQHFLPDAPTLRQDHFGMDWSTAIIAIDQIRSCGRPQLAGFHLFAGSHTFNRAGMAIAEAALPIVAAFEERYGARLSLINLGGGLGERWNEEALDFPAYRALLARIPSHVQILHESGRALFASSTTFLVSVVTTKQIEGRHYAICDGGMNQNFLLCQTENRFSRLKRPVVFRKYSEPSGELVTTFLMGSTCSRDDAIGIVEGPVLKTGDLCLFDYCGAYHSTYTVGAFLGLKEAVHYVIP